MKRDTWLNEFAGVFDIMNDGQYLSYVYIFAIIILCLNVKIFHIEDCSNYYFKKSKMFVNIPYNDMKL